MKSLREEEIRYEFNQVERNLYHARQNLYSDTVLRDSLGPK